MPTVMVWNLERFGSKVTDDAGRAIAKNMIAALISDLAADVVIIQELRREGVALLAGVATVVGQLTNATWNFDWIPGGIGSGMDPEDVGWSEMTFSVTNSEGYAVLWRDGALAPFTSKRSGGLGNSNAGGRKGKSYIDVCLTGYEMDVSFTFGEPTLKRASQELGQGIFGFPDGECGAAAQYRSYNRQASWSRNEHVMATYYSRRAVYISVQRTKDCVDVVAYHAPNEKHATMYGPILALNTSTPNLAGLRAVAGDWNTVDQQMRAGVGSTAVTSYKMTSPIIDKSGSCSGQASMVHSHERCTGGEWLGTSLGAGKSPFTHHRDFVITANGAPKAYVTSVDELFRKPQNRTIRLAGSAAYTLLGQGRRAILLQFKDGSWKTFERYSISNAQIVTAFLGSYSGYDGNDDTDGVRAATGNDADFSTGFALLYNHYVSDHLPVVIEL